MTTTSMVSSATQPATSKTTVKRYHPALVSLHWIVAILIFATVLFAGEEGEGEGAQGGRLELPTPRQVAAGHPRHRVGSDQA